MVLHEVVALNADVNNQLASCSESLESLLPKFHLSLKLQREVCSSEEDQQKRLLG